MRGVLRILLFVVVGPFIGLLAMSVLIGTYTLILSGSTRDYAIGPDLFAPGPLLLTYTIGTIPALAAGIASIFIARRWAGWPGWLLTALAGGVVSLAVTWAMVGPPSFLSAGSDAQMTLLVGIAGAIAGLVCASVFDGLSTLLRPRVA